MSKIALVTAGSKRIGASICNFLASKNWNIVIHYNKSEEEAKELCEYLSNNFAIKAYLIQADFRDIKSVEGMIQKINKEFGQISLLVNNASSFVNDKYNSFDYSSMEENLAVNAIAPSILIRDFANQNIFKEDNNGNIINILDYSIQMKPLSFYSYTLSKMALSNLIDLNVTLLAPKIRINGIMLGPTMLGQRQKQENFEISYKNSLLQTKTELTDVHSAINFILEIKTITGDIIKIDSGLRMQVNSAYI